MARGDDVQANFWKLLNNVNFGFDCRDNSQNKSLHLIYDENTEVELISKYSKYYTNNCLLDLDARIKNIEEYYSNLDNLEGDKQPNAKTLKQEEIERVMHSYSRKRKGKKSKLLSHVEHFEKACSNKAYTFVQELEEDDVSSVKGVACKKQTMVMVSLRHISSNLLINAKIFLVSFIYDCIDTFSFPNE